MGLLAAMITIVLVLAAVLLGGLIPQGMPADLYLDRFGAKLGPLLLQSGLHDIYNTKGFMLLGLALFVQLMLCTFRRVVQLRHHRRMWLAGSVLLHVGLLVFFVFCGLSLWRGQSLTVEVPEGETVALTSQGMPFDLRLETFVIDYYPQSRSVRQYRSEVSLMREGLQLRRGSLEVNSPLIYEGVKIYQMSYGWKLEGSIRQLPAGKDEAFSTVNGGWITVGGDKTRVRAVLMADPDRHPSVVEPEVAFLLLTEAGDRQAAVLSVGTAAQAGDFEIRLDKIRRYSGLQVKSDPAITGVFSGLGLVMLGLLLRYLPWGGK